MAGKRRHHAAVHEAGHAVIARTLGVGVPTVSVRSSSEVAVSESAAYLVRNSSDVAARIAALETDAKVSLAGRAANHREVPHLPIFDLDLEDEDSARAVSGIYQAESLRRGEAIPEDGTKIKLDEQHTQALKKLIGEVATLIDQYWPAIRRVATHLERHTELDQAELDRLIDIGMRNAGASRDNT
jgi:hypothetical protein